MHNINWHAVQKCVEAAIIFGWEHWLSQTTLVKAGSTVELVWNGFKILKEKLFTKGVTK